MAGVRHIALRAGNSARAHTHHTHELAKTRLLTCDGVALKQVQVKHVEAPKGATLGHSELGGASGVRSGDRAGDCDGCWAGGAVAPVLAPVMLCSNFFFLGTLTGLGCVLWLQPFCGLNSCGGHHTRESVIQSQLPDWLRWQEAENHLP